jgi:hypothetical protein
MNARGLSIQQRLIDEALAHPQGFAGLSQGKQDGYFMLTAPGTLAQIRAGGVNDGIALKFSSDAYVEYSQLRGTVSQLIGRKDTAGALQKMPGMIDSWALYQQSLIIKAGAESQAIRTVGRSDARSVLKGAYDELIPTTRGLKGSEAVVGYLLLKVEEATHLTFQRGFITESEYNAYLKRLEQFRQPAPQPIPGRPTPGEAPPGGVRRGWVVAGGMRVPETGGPHPVEVAARYVGRTAAEVAQAVRAFFEQDVVPDQEVMEYLRQRQPATYKRILDDLQKRRK